MSRVPIIQGPIDEEVVSHWVHNLNSAGLLYNVDDDPEDVISLNSGAQLFTFEECAILNGCIQDIMDANLYVYLQSQILDLLQ